MNNTKIYIYNKLTNDIPKISFNFGSDIFYPEVAPLIWDCSNFPLKLSQLKFELALRDNKKFRELFIELENQKSAR